MSVRVLIAGSGVAAVEAVLALRDLARSRRFDIDLLAPAPSFDNPAMSVATPFGFGAMPPLDLHELAGRYSVTLVQGELTGVDVEARTAHVHGGDDRPYDHLLVAVGARREPALDGAVTFRGPADVPTVQWILDEAARGHRATIVVAAPSAVGWTLPAYELAIMAQTELKMRGAADASITVVTPEREPLWIFGEPAGVALRALLSERGIGLRTGARPAHVTDGVLWLESGDAMIADTVLSLARHTGPRIAGLPADDAGFLPTDPHGHVMGASHVLAAGDATTFPIKQGGLATQQADAAAATLAQELGAAVVARPFVPVLRGLLLTGGAPLYLRAELDAAGAPRTAPRQHRLRGEVSSRALWWPPGKIAGRYLAPYLSTARPVSLGDEPLIDRRAGAAAAAAPEHEAALDLALLLADEDAAAGDFAQALHALDAAAALSGGILPAAYAQRQKRWRAALTDA